MTSLTAFLLLILTGLCHGESTKRITKKQQKLNWKENEHTAEATESQSMVRRADDGLSNWEPVVAQLTQQLSQATAEILALKNTVNNLQQTISTNTRGSGTDTYVRWGSSSCPAADTLVYHGTVGGSAHTESGGAVNFLCLPQNPQLSGVSAPASHADLFGSEYQTGVTTSANADPLCTVCLSVGPTIMIPAQTACPAGWRLAYQGFLMSGKSAHAAASEFICVDEALEKRAGSTRNQEGKLLFYTLTHCGSLPCPPYVDRKVVSCVVCSA